MNFSQFLVPLVPNPSKPIQTLGDPDGSSGALQSCLPMPELRGWAVLQALRDLEEGEEVPMEFRRSREMVGTWDLHLLEVPTSGSASVQSRICARHIPLLGQQSQVTIEYVAPWLNARKHVEFIGALFCSFFCQNIFPPAILQADSPDRHQQLLEQWQFECNCGKRAAKREHAVACSAFCQVERVAASQEDNEQEYLDVTYVYIYVRLCLLAVAFL